MNRKSLNGELMMVVMKQADIGASLRIKRSTRSKSLHLLHFLGISILDVYSLNVWTRQSLKVFAVCERYVYSATRSASSPDLAPHEARSRHDALSPTLRLQPHHIFSIINHYNLIHFLS